MEIVQLSTTINEKVLSVSFVRNIPKSTFACVIKIRPENGIESRQERASDTNCGSRTHARFGHDKTNCVKIFLRINICILSPV